MSHFTVLIFDEDIEKQLAPFQENNMGNCPEEYMEFNDLEDGIVKEWEEDKASMKEWYESVRFTASDIGEENIKKLIEEGKVEIKNLCNFETTFTEIKPDMKCSVLVSAKSENKIYFQAIDVTVDKNLVPAKREYYFTALKIDPPNKIPIQEYYKDFETYVKDHHGLKERDPKTGRYGYWENPNKKWDWYQIGGRWAGFFKLKNGCTGELGSKSWCNEDKEIGVDRADQARKGDIDWDGMLLDDFEHYSQRYDEFEKLLKENPANAKKNAYWEYGIENVSGKSFDEEWIPESREQYLKRAIPTTFAVIKDGKWYEKGSMGWWGHVSDRKDNDTWAAEFKKLIESVDDNTLLTMVDCHI